MIIDITRSLPQAEVYPGDPEPMLSRIKTLDADGLNLTVLTACVHTGTHADAPLHYIYGGEDAAKLSLSEFAGRCEVIKLPGGIAQNNPSDGIVQPSQLKNSSEGIVQPSQLKNPSGVRIMLFAGAQFAPGCAAEFARLGVKTVGTDTMSIAPENAEERVHREFFHSGINIIECLDLSGAQAGEYLFCGFPLKLCGSDGAPMRAVLMSAEDILR